VHGDFVGAEDPGKGSLGTVRGQWPAPLLIMGSYNKMVKQHGSDSQSNLAA
jgi:hypothetical protein